MGNIFTRPHYRRSTSLRSAYSISLPLAECREKHTFVCVLLYSLDTLYRHLHVHLYSHTQSQNHNQWLIFWNKKRGLSGWHIVCMCVCVCLCTRVCVSVPVCEGKAMCIRAITISADSRWRQENKQWERAGGGGTS